VQQEHRLTFGRSLLLHGNFKHGCLDKAHGLVITYGAVRHPRTDTHTPRRTHPRIRPSSMTDRFTHPTGILLLVGPVSPTLVRKVLARAGVPRAPQLN